MPTGLRKPTYAQEVMLRVSWSCLSHSDDQPPHTRRGEVMLDLGLEQAPDPELTRDEMQRVAFAAKVAALKVLGKRPRPKFDRRRYSEEQIEAMANDGRLIHKAMALASAAGQDWVSLDDEAKDNWNERAIEQLRSERRAVELFAVGDVVEIRRAPGLPWEAAHWRGRDAVRMNWHHVTLVCGSAESVPSTRIRARGRQG